MGLPYHTSQFSFRNSVKAPVGQITSAGVIVNGAGVPAGEMRVYGSYAIVYILEGSGCYEDAHGCREDVEPGDLIVVFPDIAHTYSPPVGRTWTELFLIFEGEVFDLYRRQGILDASRPVHHLASLTTWLSHLEAFLRQPPTTAFGKAQETNRFLGLLTEMLLAEAGEPQEEWLSHACRLLGANLEKEDALPSFAAQVGMPYETFRKYFRTQMGMSPAYYRALRRIEAATELLRFTGMTNCQVAEAVGFGDEYSFIKRFKQIKGLTPFAFRCKLR